MNEPSQAPGSPAAQAQVGKKPYEKPAIAWEEPLEVRPSLMIACGKIIFQQSGCESVQGS